MVNYNRKADLWDAISTRFNRAVLLAQQQARVKALREGGDADEAAYAVSLRMGSAEEKAKLWIVRVRLVLVVSSVLLLSCIELTAGWASIEGWFGGGLTRWHDA